MSYCVLICYTDHIAVQLFILEDVGSLTLHFPCAWDGAKFCDDGCKGNPGATANKLHKHFTTAIHEDSLKQIDDAIQLGAIIKVHKGFLQRNYFVAKSEYLIAFTWGKEDVPKEGGTLDTWKKCQGMKLHFPLDSLLLSNIEACDVPRKRKRPAEEDSVEPQKN